MFKDEYKKHYDKIHPSPELVERTKKIAFEQYQNKMLESEKQSIHDIEKEEESYETEKIEDTKEEKIIFLGMGRKKILQMAGGLAAGIAVITVGYLFSGTLQQESGTVGTVVKNTREPVDSSEPTIFPSKIEEENGKQKEKDNDKKKNEGKKEEPKEQSNSPLTTLAKMGNAGGVRLDYASEDFVIFHGNFGILGYRISSGQLVVKIPAEKYQHPDMWNTEQVMVNQNVTKIAWYNLVSSSTERKVYDIATGEYSTMDDLEWGEENLNFSGTMSVVGTDADVYSSKATDMCVRLSENRTCQLIYQAPTLSLQASLGIAIVDMAGRTEQIYDVFGSVGRQIAQSYGATYGGYHNDYGKEIFELKSEETVNPEVTTNPETEPTESAIATEPPVEVTSTPIPEPTEEAIKPEVTENVQKIQDVENEN